MGFGEEMRSGRWETRPETRLGDLHSGALSRVPGQKLYTKSMVLCEAGSVVGMCTGKNKGRQPQLLNLR